MPRVITLECVNFYVYCTSLCAAMLRTPLAGDFVTAQVRSYFEEAGVEIVPSFYIASKVGEKTGRHMWRVRLRFSVLCVHQYPNSLCRMLSRKAPLQCGHRRRTFRNYPNPSTTTWSNCCCKTSLPRFAKCPRPYLPMSEWVDIVSPKL